MSSWKAAKPGSMILTQASRLTSRLCVCSEWPQSASAGEAFQKVQNILVWASSRIAVRSFSLHSEAIKRFQAPARGWRQDSGRDSQASGLKELTTEWGTWTVHKLPPDRDNGLQRNKLDTMREIKKGKEEGG